MDATALHQEIINLTQLIRFHFALLIIGLIWNFFLSVYVVRLSRRHWRSEVRQEIRAKIP